MIWLCLAQGGRFAPEGKERDRMRAKQILKMAVLILLAAILALIIYCRISLNESPGEGQSNTDVLSAGEAAMEPPAASFSPAPEPSAVPTASPPPTATPEPYPDIDIGEWQYTLVNAEHLLDRSHAPELTELENGQYFDSRAVEALKSFIEAARGEGFPVYLRSSYRTYATQESLYNNKVAQMQSWYGYDYDKASEEARKIVAVPGSSEHQLGLACDIVDGYYEYMNETLADTALLQWMGGHCAEYGFILRYPKDKTEKTGVMYEPWHFRYVGTEAAAYIMESGICLEEFHEIYA
jgi:D-alanyl-D-alanine carboxypeptidase